jgi:hypothetical protein
MSPDSTLVPAATRRPQSALPALAAGSVRRASHVRLRWPEVDADPLAAPMQVHGAVRDVATDRDGTARLLGDATLGCTIAADRTLTAVWADPVSPELSALVGRSASRGWRAAARQVAADETRLGALLADVPIAVLLSSYGALRQGRIELAAVETMAGRMRNACAGWADGATPMRSLEAGGGLPLPGIVPLDSVEVDAASGMGPLTTEPRPPLAPGELRRTRLLDVGPVAWQDAGGVRLVAGFRDSWHDPAAGASAGTTRGEGVLHEYVLVAELSTDLVVESIAADPRVLPYRECTLAAQSPERLVGHRVDDVRHLGPTGDPTACTHLNDLLRTLAAVPVLLRESRLSR